MSIVSKDIPGADRAAEFILPVKPGFDEEQRRIADALRTLEGVEERSLAEISDEVQGSLNSSTIDPLTGLCYFETPLGTLVRRNALNMPLSVLILDIDSFKSINDAHGHVIGDNVLKQISSRLKKSIRDVDLVFRHDGDEFVVVMPDVEMTRATAVAEHLRHRIAAEPFSIDRGTDVINVTISAGIAVLEAHEGRPDDILRLADEALYRAKREGRNRVVAAAAA